MAATTAADPLLELKGKVAHYYGGRLRRHGATPLGVDWTCEPTQQLRFVQLLRLCDFSRPFSLNDVGCGYGALLPFIAGRHDLACVDYLGTDLSAAMVARARRLWSQYPNASFEVGSAGARTADYAVASGIFNVRLDEPLARWEAFAEATLRDMAATTRLGFAVNFLSVLPSAMQGKPELYRTTPMRWKDFCVNQLRRDATVLADYGMREFTLLARS